VCKILLREMPEPLNVYDKCAMDAIYRGATAEDPHPLPEPLSWGDKDDNGDPVC
jgi:hypothetical protein